MKTRILHTKIWKDKYFTSLDANERIAFLYLLTNEHINMSGVYELNDLEFQMWTKIDPHELEKIKEKFHRDRKFYFVDGWVIVSNHDRYNNYGKGKWQEEALEKELRKTPEKVKNYLPRDEEQCHSMPPGNTSIDTSIDTSVDTDPIPLKIINNKQKTINNKQENNNNLDNRSSQKGDWLDVLGSGSAKISHFFQDEGFRIAEGLKIEIPNDWKSRWLALFKSAEDNPGLRSSIARAYGFLVDYPRFQGLDHDSKIRYFFWAVNHSGELGGSHE